MEQKHKEIGKLLRQSIDADYCYDCPFRKLCDKIQEQEALLFPDCDTIRIIAIEEKLKEYDKTL